LKRATLTRVGGIGDGFGHIKKAEKKGKKWKSLNEIAFAILNG